MYQPYPTGGQGPVTPPEAPAPQPVQNAVKLMYAGAALSAIEIIIGLTTIGSLKSAIRSQYPNYSDSQIHTAEVAGIAIAVAIGAIAIGLWLWMAWANGRGRSWARIVASALFALNTIDLLTLVARPHSVISLVLAIVVWLAGLGAIYFLWQRDSSAFFQARSPRAR
jgi:hypothetical protein